jgi:hypothetical protein
MKQGQEREPLFGKPSHLARHAKPRDEKTVLCEINER